MALILTGIWIGANRYRYFEVLGPSARGTGTTVQTLEKHGFEVFSEVKGTTLQGVYREVKGKVIGSTPGRVYILLEERNNEVFVIGKESSSKTAVDIVPNSVKLLPYKNVSVVSVQLKPMDNFTNTKKYFKRLLKDVNYSNAFVSCDLIYQDVNLPEQSTTWELKRKVSGGILVNNTEEGSFVRAEFVPYSSFKLLNSEILEILEEDVSPDVGSCSIKIYLKKEIPESPRELNIYHKGNIEYVEVK